MNRKTLLMLSAGIVVVVVILCSMTALANPDADYTTGTNADNAHAYVQLQCEIANRAAIGLTPAGTGFPNQISIQEITGEIVTAPAAKFLSLWNTVPASDFKVIATLTMVGNASATATVDTMVQWADLTSAYQTITIGKPIGVQAGTYTIDLGAWYYDNTPNGYAWVEVVEAAGSVVVP